MTGRLLRFGLVGTAGFVVDAGLLRTTLREELGAITAADNRPLDPSTSARKTITALACPDRIAAAASPKAPATPPPPPPQTTLDHLSSRVPRAGINRTGSFLSSP